MTRYVGNVFVFVAALCVMGCVGQGGDGNNTVSDEKGQHKVDQQLTDGGESYVFYDKIEGFGASYKPIGFCDLVNRFEGSKGLFRVVELKGATEESMATAGSIEGFTYVTLETLAVWDGNIPDTVVARIEGGPVGGGSTMNWFVSLDKDEEVGIFFVEPTEENLGYPNLDGLGVFRESSTGYSNGQLFVDEDVGAAELGKMVTAIVQADGECVYDATPTMFNDSPSGQSDVVITTEEVVAEQLY